MTRSTFHDYNEYQRHDYKDSDQGIVHGSKGLPFSMISDNGPPMTPLRASASATFDQDRTDVLNNHHHLGHISIKQAKLLNLDRIQQPLLEMPKIKCPVCIASKATRQKRPSASTADTRCHRTMARHLLGSLRQNANPIHERMLDFRRFCMPMVRCQTLRIYCSQESLHRRILLHSGNDGHQATLRPHTPSRSRKRMHQSPDASSLRRTSNEPRCMCQRRALLCRSSQNRCKQYTT